MSATTTKQLFAFLALTCIIATDAIFSRQFTSLLLRADPQNSIGVRYKDSLSSRTIPTAVSSVTISGGSSATSSNISNEGVGNYTEEITNEISEIDESKESVHETESTIELEQGQGDVLIETDTSVAESVAEGSPTVTGTDEQVQEDQIKTTEQAHEKSSESSLSNRQQKRIELKAKRKKAREDRKKLRQLSKKLKSRNNMNIKRKILHAGFGIFFATMNQIIPKSIFVPAMTVVSTGCLGVELLRYRKGWEWMNKIMHIVLGGTLRRQEMEGKFTGSFYYFTGVTLTAALFPKSCASLGICQLALADPSASYFGMQTKHIYWSRIENGLMGIGRNKGFLGFLGGALFCVPFNYRLLSIAKYGVSKSAIPGSPQSVILASLLLGLAGAFADLLVPSPALTMPKKLYGVPMPPFHVDDNVVVPLLSGYACTKIFGLLGWTETIQLGKYLVF